MTGSGLPLNAFRLLWNFDQVGDLDSRLRARCIDAAMVWQEGILGWPTGNGWKNITHLRVFVAYMESRHENDVIASVDPGKFIWAPTHSGVVAFLPEVATIELNRVALEVVLQGGLFEQFQTAISHELGHVLGFGTIWQEKCLIQHSPGDPKFIGLRAMIEYGRLLGTYAPTPVPIENVGDWGARRKHWRTSVFSAGAGASAYRLELMTSIVWPFMTLSRLTLQSLADLGYVVNERMGYSYELPDPNSHESRRDGNPAVDGASRGYSVPS